MRLTFMLKQIGKQLILMGFLIQLAGFLMLLYEAWGVGGIRWGNLIWLVVGAGAIAGGVWGYQRIVFWKKLRERLLRAKPVHEAPNDPYRQIPWWLWAFIFITAFSCSGAVGGTFGMLLGAVFIGYGLSGNFLAAQVEELERGRSEFYAVRNDQRQSSIVQLISSE